MTTPLARLDSALRSPSNCRTAFAGVGAYQLLTVLGRTQEGYLNDETMLAYLSLIEQHYAHDRRLAFYNPWFFDILSRTDDEETRDPDDPGPWTRAPAEERPEHLARVHDDPKSGYVEFNADNSVCFFSVYEGSAPIMGDVGHRHFGNGHYWAAIAYMHDSRIHCWDSLGPQELSKSRINKLILLARYLNARLALRALPAKKWFTRLDQHAGLQRDPSCGIYVLKTIELAAATPEHVWRSELTAPLVAAYRRQVACSLHEARLLRLSDLDAAAQPLAATFISQQQQPSVDTSASQLPSPTSFQSSPTAFRPFFKVPAFSASSSHEWDGGKGFAAALEDSYVVRTPQRELVATTSMRALAELLSRQHSFSYVDRQVVVMSETRAGFEQANALMAALLELHMQTRLIHVAFRDDREHQLYVMPRDFRIYGDMPRPLPVSLQEPFIFVALEMRPASVQSRLYVNHLQPWARDCEFWDVWTSACAHVHARCFLPTSRLEDRPDLYALSCHELVGSPLDLRRQSTLPYRGLETVHDCFPLCVA